MLDGGISGNYMYMEEHFQGEWVKWKDVKEKREMNKWEKACKEYLKGCSCSDPNHPEQCEECHGAFYNHLRELAKEDDFKDINQHCIKEDKRGTIPTKEFKKEDIKKVDGSPTIAWGDFYINGKDIDQYIIDVVAKDINQNGILRKVHKKAGISNCNFISPKINSKEIDEYIIDVINKVVNDHYIRSKIIEIFKYDFRHDGFLRRLFVKGDL